MKQVKRWLLTIDGPEFSNEEHGSEGLCSSKVSKKSSNGLHITITSDQRPLHGVAKTWSRRRSRALICSAGYIHTKVDQWLLCRSCRGKYRSCSTTHATGCTYKSRGMVVGSVQTVAAIANDESLQVRVRKAHPPEGRSSRHLPKGLGAPASRKQQSGKHRFGCAASGSGIPKLM